MVNKEREKKIALSIRRGLVINAMTREQVHKAVQLQRKRGRPFTTVELEKLSLML